MQNLFIELLRVSLGTREQLSRLYSIHEWEESFHEAQRQAIAGIFVDGLDRLPKEQLPPKSILIQWVGLSQLLSGAYSLHCKRSSEIVSIVAKEGFRSCIIKGISVAHYYPNPERRQFGDIDLWVDGRRKDVMKWLKKYPIEHSVWHNVGVAIFKDVPVEIHFHPGWLYNPIRNIRLQKWFNEKIEHFFYTDSGLSITTPSNTFNAVYSLLHSFRHLMSEGIGMRHIVDFYYLVKVLTEEEKIETTILIQRFGLRRFAGGMMWILRYICGLTSSSLLIEPNEKEGRLLFEDVMGGGNFGHYRLNHHGLAKRMRVMIAHYPGEVLWIVPWKIWHNCWRFLHNSK